MRSQTHSFVPRSSISPQGHTLLSLADGPVRVLDLNKDIDIHGTIALATAPDHANKETYVLARPEDHQSKQLLTVLCADYSRARSIDIENVPAPPDIVWPWSVAVGENDSIAFATGKDVFEVVVTDLLGKVRFRIPGAAIKSPHRPRLQGEADFVPGLAGAIASLDDTSIMVIDRSANQLLSVEEGVASSSLQGTAFLDVDVSDDAVYLVSSDEIVRFDASSMDEPLWRRACDCDSGARIAAGTERVFVGLPSSQEVLEIDIENGQLVRNYDYADATGTWPVDLTTADNTLVTIDQGQLQVWDAKAEPSEKWPIGLVGSARRLGRSTASDPSSFLILTSRGLIEEYSRGDGNLLQRWPVHFPNAIGFSPSEFAVSRDGTRIFFSDISQGQVRMFAASATGSTPVPTETPSPEPTLAVERCTVSGDKIARPQRIPLGARTSLTLTLELDCPGRPIWSGADMILLLDRSESMRGNKLDQLREFVHGFAGQDLGEEGHYAFASFADSARIDQEFSVDTIQGRARMDAFEALGTTNLREGLDVIGPTARYRCQWKGRCPPHTLYWCRTATPQAQTFGALSLGFPKKE